MKQITPFEAAALAYEDCANECERLAELAKTSLRAKLNKETTIGDEAAAAAVAVVRGAMDGFAQAARHRAANARDEEARILKTVTH